MFDGCIRGLWRLHIADEPTLSQFAQGHFDLQPSDVLKVVETHCLAGADRLRQVHDESFKTMSLAADYLATKNACIRPNSSSSAAENPVSVGGWPLTYPISACNAPPRSARLPQPITWPRHSSGSA